MQQYVFSSFPFFSFLPLPIYRNIENIHNENIRFIYLLFILAASSQIRSLYRYGHMAECTSFWTDFKFCLSLRALSAEERRVAWIQNRAEWWVTRRMGGSSEDVWEVRKYVPLFHLSPFSPFTRQLSRRGGY